MAVLKPSARRHRRRSPMGRKTEPRLTSRERLDPGSALYRRRSGRCDPRRGEHRRAFHGVHRRRLHRRYEKRAWPGGCRRPRRPSRARRPRCSRWSPDLPQALQDARRGSAGAWLPAGDLRRPRPGDGGRRCGGVHDRAAPRSPEPRPDRPVSRSPRRSSRHHLSGNNMDCQLGGSGARRREIGSA